MAEEAFQEGITITVPMSCSKIAVRKPPSVEQRKSANISSRLLARDVPEIIRVMRGDGLRVFLCSRYLPGLALGIGATE